MPGSHLFVFLTQGMLNILIRMVFHPTSSKSKHSCNATQYLGHLTATDYMESLQKSAVTTAASTSSTDSGHSMTSFVNMFVSARYTCNDKKAVRMFRAQFRE